MTILCRPNPNLRQPGCRPDFVAAAAGGGDGGGGDGGGADAADTAAAAVAATVEVAELFKLGRWQFGRGTGRRNP